MSKSQRLEMIELRKRQTNHEISPDSLISAEIKLKMLQIEMKRKIGQFFFSVFLAIVLILFKNSSMI